MLFAIIVGTLLCGETLMWPGLLIGLLAGAIPIWKFVKLFENDFYKFIIGKNSDGK